MNEVRIGVIGCGTAAIDLCRSVEASSGVRVAGAFDTDALRMQHVAARCGARSHQSVDDLLADDQIDAVYIATPHHLLAGLTERAISTRHHAFVEKPMALDARTATGLGDLAARYGVQLGVNFPLRHSAPVQWASDAIRAGAIGEIRAVRVRTVLDKPPDYWAAGAPPGGRLGWRARHEHAGGGVVLMNGIHLLDVVRFVTGVSFRRVTADVASFASGLDVEDVAGAVMRLSSGAIVSLSATSDSPGAADEETISIDGTGGRIDLPFLLDSEPLQLFLREPWESWPVGRWNPVVTSSRDCHGESLRSFLDAVRAQSSPLPRAADAAAMLDVVAAVYESSRSGRAVEIPATAASFSRS